MKSIYLLVDCNNFYVSCERAFKPHLNGRPVVVLSNNDGNVVSLSNEVKELGLPFGSPLFKVREQIKRHGIEVFSSNYTLYGDMSRRVMECLSYLAPEVEIYSIDEAFIFLRGGCPDPAAYGRRIRETVGQWTGIPVSVGIAPTKTLAKLANRAGKRDPSGVFDLTASDSIERLLCKTEVREIWGVGHQYSKMLNMNGIRTALQLRDAPDKWVKRKMTIMGLRTVWELRGISCIPVDQLGTPKKGIVSSRSFGRPIEELEELKEAVATYVTRGAEKLRAQGSVTGAVTLFLATNRFKEDEPQYSNGITYRLLSPTSYTPGLIQLARQLLERIYRPGYRYKKAGIMLYDIIPEKDYQLNLFSRFNDTERTRKIMETVDGLNKRMGRNSLYFAAEGIVKPWGMRREFLSGRYTTHWEEIPVVRA